jgi:pyroglutamyl-peptidase
MNSLAYLAAFEPFGGRAKNRSWDVARRVNLPDGVELVQLPVEFARLGGAVASLLSARPSALLLLGEAPIREVAVEGVALNLIHAEGADNAGNAPTGVPVVRAGPLALWAGWDVCSVVEAIRMAGVPARPSYHAGTYACNAALYHALHNIQAAGGVRDQDTHHRGLAIEAPRTAVGFIHLPRSYRGPGSEIAALVHAVEIGMREILRAGTR